MSWSKYTNATAPQQAEKIARSLKFATVPTARIAAEKSARQITSGNTTTAAMRNSDAASFGRAAELLEPTGVSAAAHFAEAFRILSGDKLIEAALFYTNHNRICWSNAALPTWLPSWLHLNWHAHNP